MGLTTERKLFMGVLFVAGAALVIDRGILAPSGAEAAAVDLPADASASLLIEPSGTTPAAKPTKTIAKVLMDRLGSVQAESEENSLASAFSIEELLSSTVEEAAESVDDLEPKLNLTQLIPSDADLPTLGAVMPAARGSGGAILNGKMVRQGQETPEGFMLEEVRERSVVLVRNGRRYVIEMPMQIQP